MVTDPRLPAPMVRDIWTRASSASSYAEGVSFQIAAVDLPQNTGTYVDCPFHRHADGRGTWDFPLQRLADLPGVLVDARAAAARSRALGPGVFGDLDLAGRAVLVRTGWDARWGTHAYASGEHPFLTAEAAQHLVDRGAALYGVDALNADAMTDPARPAHTILLGADVPIVENLTGLAALEGAAFRFHAAPVRVEGLGSFPVRAYAVIEGRLGS